MSHEELTKYKEEQQRIEREKLIDQKRQKDAEEAKDQEDKHKAYVELEDKIVQWSGTEKNRNNIRSLLCTIQSILWEGAEWTPFSFTDLMDNNKLKKAYFKAMNKFHPDRNGQTEYKAKYICERITNALNEAWDEHRKTNP